MRMRKKKHGMERIEACGELIINSPENVPEKILNLEIGCGKGAFIAGCAEKNPDVEYIAIEKISDVLLLAAEKIKEKDLKNVHFLRIDAKNITDFIKPNSVNRIYLNFSDPWPKKGYMKRRLTYKDYLNIYKNILTPDGAIFLKTDNQEFFDFSLEQLAENGFELKNITYDLHNSEYNADNIVTEYETNFSEKGFTIKRVEAYLK